MTAGECLHQTVQILAAFEEGFDQNALIAAMETSIIWPLPVWVRWKSAEATPSAAVAPDMAMWRADYARYGQLVKEAGIKAES